MSFVYGLVAYQSVPLAEFETSQGNFTQIARELLEKIQHSDSRTVFEQNDFVFSAFGDKSGLTVLVLSKSSIDARTRFFVVDEIKNKWTSLYGAKAASMRPMEKNNEFRGEIQRIFIAMESPTQAKIQQINKNIIAAQEIMTQNLSSAIARGEQLTVMEKKAEEIKSSSQQFQRDASKIRKEMCWRRYLWYIIGISIVLVIILIIVLVVITKKKKKNN